MARGASDSLINHVQTFPAKHDGRRYAFLLCGFGGSVWQTRRLINVLCGAGYNVTALDFDKRVLGSGDPALLPSLVDETLGWANGNTKKIGQPILLVGISLGSLISLNLLRRSDRFRDAVMLTGGDIVKVAQNIYGHNVWPQSYTQLSEMWAGVNIYSDPTQLSGKRLVFVLPARDTLIDPADVRAEAKKQLAGGNSLALIERRSFRHVGTIVEETVVFPKRVLGYIRRLEQV